MPPNETKPGADAKAISRSVRFSEQYILRTLGVSRSQLRAWERAGWISAQAKDDESGGTFSSPTSSRRNRQLSASPGSGDWAERQAAARRKPVARYAHADLLALKTLLRLRRGGVPARKLRAIHASLMQRFDALGIRRPFSELHLTGQNKRVLLTFRGARMEPLTGQLLLEYSGSETRPLAMPARPSVARNPKAERVRRAERLFAAGLRLEQTPGGTSRAIRAYRAAIELNPRAIGALLNLGTLYYNQREMGEAERCYRAALEVNPGSSLAHFNMGNLADEIGDAARAITHYEKAIALDPAYPDPRYNLALVFEKIGRHGQAWKNWRGYLKLDPDSKWAALARDKLAAQPWQVVRSPQNRALARDDADA